MLFGTKMARTLRDHEDVCNIRYQAIDEKLAKLEQKVDEIREEIDGFKTFIVKLAVKSCVSIFAVVCAAVFVVKF